MRRCLNCMREYAEEYEDKCPYCGYIHGATHEEDMGLLPGTILQNRYIVGTVIRVRDVDVCYRGWDAIFDRQVRIQEYFPRYCAARFGASPLTIYESKQEPYREGLELFLRQSRELVREYREPDV
ncbi:MAG: hypothetical protein LUE86_02850, partial [Clostridiales bacterium]|nr:hypothetical protein [Clostridiales bacterium]